MAKNVVTEARLPSSLACLFFRFLRSGQSATGSLASVLENPQVARIFQHDSATIQGVVAVKIWFSEQRGLSGVLRQLGTRTATYTRRLVSIWTGRSRRGKAGGHLDRRMV